MAPSTQHFVRSTWCLGLCRVASWEVRKAWHLGHSAEYDVLRTHCATSHALRNPSSVMHHSSLPAAHVTLTLGDWRESFVLRDVASIWQRQCDLRTSAVDLFLLKNSNAIARSSVVEKVDPLERAQSDAISEGDGLRPPKSMHEQRGASFSTESTQSRRS